MPKGNVYVVQLRNPGSRDRRRDPFWELGSFGLTGCHAKNLMNKKHKDQLEGARLAFAQGGPRGICLVLLTPPVRIREHRRCLEARWNPRVQPFRYSSAPVLVHPGVGQHNKTEFTEIERAIRHTHRKTWPGKFSSCFRSKCHPLGAAAARQLSTLYKEHKGQRCADYTQARPNPPAHKMSRRERGESYQRLLRRASQTC